MGSVGRFSQNNLKIREIPNSMKSLLESDGKRKKGAATDRPSERYQSNHCQRRSIRRRNHGNAVRWSGEATVY